MFHIFDAPCHGTKYHGGGGDSYPKGCPKGLVLEDLLKQFQSRDIKYTAIQLEAGTKQMCEIMKKTYPGLVVTDIGSAAKGKTSAEVDTMFVDSASYILRAAVGGKDGKSSAKRTATKSKPLWDDKQLSVG